MSLSWPSPKLVKRTVLTLVIALLGGVIASWFHMPAPLLIGALISVSIAGFGGLDLGLPTPIVSAGFVIVGMLLGSNVASNTLELVPLWPVSLFAVFVMLFLMVGVGSLALRRLFGMNAQTAVLCSVPGHLTMVLALASTGNADSRKVVVVQSIRLLFLTLFVPLVALIGGIIPVQVAHDVQVMSPLTLLALGASCVAAGLVFKRLSIPAPLVLGSMLVSVTGKVAGFYEGVLPMPLVALGLLIIGALVASRTSDITLQELKSSVLAGLVMTLIAVVTVSGTALLVGQFVDMPLGQIWLGLSPGGLEAMGALGVAMGFDAAFIAAHHTWRLLLLGVAIPTMPALFNRFGKAAPKLPARD